MSAGETATASRPHKFVLQARDPVTDCPVLEARISIADPGPLRRALGIEEGEDPDFDGIYDLDGDDLAALQRLTGLSFPRDLGPVQIVSWDPLRDVPYLVHTGYELALMLERRKPLAVFSDAYPADWFDEMIARFDPYVAGGRVVRRLIDEPFAKPRVVDGQRFDGIRRVFIALPDEEWRIEAYLALWQSLKTEGWSEERERRQGELLGYEEWQRDWWAAHRPGKAVQADLTPRR
ncbi:hypothetical protein EV560_106208 [Bosea sp. BK604]|nr:hypothetical protein EV560_106208 [Bosea sp. BK604]